MSATENKRKRNLDYKRKWAKAKRQSNKEQVEQEESLQGTSSDDIISSNEVASVSTVTEPSDQEIELDSDTSDTNENCWNIVDNLEQVVHVLSSGSDSESDSDKDDIEIDLAQWANEHQVKHRALDDLLKLLNRHFETELPNSARTLLRTVRDINVGEKSGMQYVYLGFKEQLIINLQRYPDNVRSSVDTISISLNIDGIPLFKSTSSSLWPVLCSINLSQRVVFPVLFTYGPSKPINLEFLDEMMEELHELLLNGFEFDEKVITVTLACVVCDAPAKALVKGIKQYSGYYGCDNCTQKGNWFGRTTYKNIDGLQLRTDLSFRNQEQREHHHRVTPFCELPIDMVRCFPIDYMHQSCLGVTKRLLLIWTKGPRETRISSHQVRIISDHLANLRCNMPNIFARKPRSLRELERWKATELRQFLLYTGKLVLKDVLEPRSYLHFLSLSVALCILVSPTLHEHRQYAHELLEFFVKEGRQLYGPEFLVYNVHSLLHLAKTVEDFTSLDDCSAFIFENYMQTLKRYVRSGKKPLVQICKRMLEVQKLDLKTRKIPKKRTTKPNNVYFVGDSNNVCEIISKSIERDEEGKKKYLCRVYSRPQSVFQRPCESALIGYLRFAKRTGSMRVLSNTELSRQAIMVSENDGRHALFMAILHNF